MRIDPTWHHRSSTQVVVDWRSGTIDGDDLGARNDDAGIVQHLPFAIQGRADSYDNAILRFRKKARADHR